MISNLEDIQLEELIEKEWLSARTINICHNADLTSLSRILDFYRTNRTFKSIRNCGSKTEKELVDICKKYQVHISIHEDSEQTESILDIVNSLSPFQKAILNRHYQYLISNLNARSYNGLANIPESRNPKEIIEKLLSPNIDIKNIRNIGGKSYQEIVNLKQELLRFIGVLKTIREDQLGQEYIKIYVKTTFTNLSIDFDKEFENVLNEFKKIKLFKLISFLIKKAELFSDIQQKLFILSYTKSEELNITLGLLASEQNLTRERVRQIKSKFEDEIQNHFLFISNLVTDDLVNYNLDISSSFLIIDQSVCDTINSDEGECFNLNFYSLIFSILLVKTHRIIGNNEMINGKRKILNFKKYKNNYLIHCELVDQFDFVNFIEDIYLKINERISETYSLHFKGYLYSFLKIEGKLFDEEIYLVCEAILYNEFDLVVDSDGYLTFERNTIKQLHEYCYDILNDYSNPMTVEELENALGEKYPFVKKTIDSIRGSLIREKNIFTCFGRKSTYALRKWELEKVNFKGGTIKELVEEYLQTKDKPQHISKIVLHVLKFRPDSNKRSILTNIKIDENRKFHFFKDSFVGLASKEYDIKIFKEIESPKTWDEKFIDLCNFRDANKNKWPSMSSNDQKERALYSMCYKAKKAFQKGTLNEEREQSLISIGFPFEEKMKRAYDWNEEFNKLEKFLNAKEKWPSAISTDKSERALYRFCYLNKKAFQKNILSLEQIAILKKIDFKFI
jgi:hypothetical protein